MKKLIVLIALAFTLTYCKDKDPEPLPGVAGIVAKWRLVSTEYTRGDSVFVNPVAASDANIIAFRYDGILLNNAGQASCCAPSSYIINGVPFQVRQVGDAPPANPSCAYIDCVSCPEWKITQQGDTLEVESCLNIKSTYVREK